MAQRSTLLEAMWEGGGDAERILERLESGDLRLIGNFMGREAELVRNARESAQTGEGEFTWQLHRRRSAPHPDSTPRPRDRTRPSVSCGCISRSGSSDSRT
jgi:hypothetical protein